MLKKENHATKTVYKRFDYAECDDFADYLAGVFWEAEAKKPAVNEIPFYKGDYAEADERVIGTRIDQKHSILGGFMDYYIVYGEEEQIRYQIYESDYDWILDRVWKENEFLFEGERVAECSSKWNAKRALYHAESYMVEYENKILLFFRNGELTEEQIAIVREKLNLK